MDRSVTRDARSGDVSVAWQVSGQGPVDLVFDEGNHELKGIPGSWHLYRVAG